MAGCFVAIAASYYIAIATNWNKLLRKCGLTWLLAHCKCKCKYAIKIIHMVAYGLLAVCCFAYHVCSFMHTNVIVVSCGHMIMITHYAVRNNKN